MRILNYLAATLLGVFLAGIPALEAVASDTSKNRFFRGLDTGITAYEQIAVMGGWPSIADGPILKLGSRDLRIPSLRTRLAITGDYTGQSSNDLAFDVDLKDAVVSFQNRNGQEPDGVVGKATLAALNIPVQDRIKQMRVNSLRWSRVPASLGERFVLVNMAGFELEVIEGERTVLDMRVVVGQAYHDTPMFSDVIRTIEINPYWNVPSSIVKNELIPSYAASTEKAVEQGFEIVRDGVAFPVDAVAWPDYLTKQFPFAVRQRPGPANALGEMKFLFPNKHNVYLHDTNARSLFKKTVRTFSHGCVRIENPRALAAYLLAANGDWPRARIDATVASGSNTRIKLKQPMPVHLAYMTAWQDRQGRIQFRPDIYGRDAKLAEEL